jgi:hypothetical protein
MPIHVELFDCKSLPERRREVVLALNLQGIEFPGHSKFLKVNDQLKGSKSQPIRGRRPKFRLSDLLDVLA